MGLFQDRLKRLEKRYLFLMKRIKENKIDDLSYDKGEASALEWVIKEVSSKFNYRSIFDNKEEDKFNN